MKMSYEYLNVDVLVVGSGAAGLRAGISAAESDGRSKVLIVGGGKIGKCGVSALAYSDRMAFHVTLPYTKPGGKDNWRYHAEDIFKIGRYVSSPKLGRILAENSAEAIEFLDRIGVPFIKDDKGRFVQFLTDGSVYPRACFTGPDTSVQITKALLKCAKSIPNISFIENCKILDVMVDDNRVYGAIGIDRFGKIYFFSVRAVILATGGAGGIYRYNCYPDPLIGSGYGIAIRAGAELVNMEFIQFGICSTKTKLACSGSIPRAIPCIIDKRGNEVLRLEGFSIEDIIRVTFRKGASWPVSFEEESRIIDILAYRYDRLYLDFTHNPSGWSSRVIPESIAKWYKQRKVGLIRTRPIDRLIAINPQIYDWLRSRGIDVRKVPIEVFEAAQHFQGGIKIDENARTRVRGLYACGECAGYQHGANRPGGNALLDTQVFGKIAGENAVKEKSTSKKLSKGIAKRYKDKVSRHTLIGLLNKVKNIMQKNVSIVRTEEGLGGAIGNLLDIRSGLEKSNNLCRYVRIDDALVSAVAVTLSALNRKESRGPHLYWRDGKIVEQESAYDRVCFVVDVKNGEFRLRKLKIKENGL